MAHFKNHYKQMDVGLIGGTIGCGGLDVVFCECAQQFHEVGAEWLDTLRCDLNCSLQNQEGQGASELPSVQWQECRQCVNKGRGGM